MRRSLALFQTRTVADVTRRQLLLSQQRNLAVACRGWRRGDQCTGL